MKSTGRYDWKLLLARRSVRALIRISVESQGVNRPPNSVFMTEACCVILSPGRSRARQESSRPGWRRVVDEEKLTPFGSGRGGIAVAGTLAPFQPPTLIQELEASFFSLFPTRAPIAAGRPRIYCSKHVRRLPSFSPGTLPSLRINGQRGGRRNGLRK
jgi:hypothetical protein